MSTEVAKTDDRKAQVPAHLQGKESETGLATNLAKGVYQTFNSISIRGSKFHLVRGGVKQTLTDDNGHALPEIKLIIVGGNDQKSKVFFGLNEEGEDEYDPDATKPPICFSSNAERPTGGTEIQAPRCDLCKWNEPGSKITKRSNRSRACATRKRIAVCGTRDFNDIYLLNLPVMSHQSLAKCAEEVASWNCPMEGVIVSVSFELDSDFPQLKFEFYDFIAEDKFAELKEAIHNNRTTIDKMINPPSDTNLSAFDDLKEGDTPSAQAKQAAERARAEGRKFPGMIDGTSSDVDPPQRAEDQPAENEKEAASTKQELDDDIPDSMKGTPPSEKQESASDGASNFGGGEAEDEAGERQMQESADANAEADAKKESKSAPGADDVDNAVPGLGSANFS